MTIRNYILILLFCSLASCKTDGFDLSSWNSQDSIGFGNISAPMAYCNKFNINEFSGILVSFYDWETEKFNTNKAYLYLWSIPYEFTYPQTNYIQLHSFYMANNKKVFSKTPMSMTLIANKNSEREILTTIGHDLLEDTNRSIDELIKNYHLLLEDIKGVHGISLSVFDVHNKPIRTTQVLIPPFEANPHTYLNNNNNERLLSDLHPFSDIAQSSRSTQIFYDKGLDFCDHSPQLIEIPPYENTVQPNANENSIEELFQDLSFVPVAPSVK